MAKFDSGKLNQIVTGTLGLIPTIVNNAKGKNVSHIEAMQDAFDDIDYDSGNYDNIIASYNAHRGTVPQFQFEDFTLSPGEYASNVLNTGLYGSQIGEAIDSWSTDDPSWGGAEAAKAAKAKSVSAACGGKLMNYGGIIGAGIGQTLSALAIPFGESAAWRNYEMALDNQKRVLENDTIKMNNAVKNTRNLMTDNALIGLKAFGGNIKTSPNPADFTNGVKVIENGGTHEENPLQGVPMGLAEDGQPNLVEEGEVIFDNYVFSNRLYADGGLLETVGLPLKYQGKSYSDIAKKLSEESEDRPLDYISKNGIKANLSKLARIQEVQRAREAEFHEFEDVENAVAAAEGGPINIKKSKKGTFTALATRKGMSLSELSDDIQAHPEKYSPEARKKEVFYRNFARKKALGGHLHGDGIPLLDTSWIANYAQEYPMTATALAIAGPNAADSYQPSNTSGLADDIGAYVNERYPDKPIENYDWSMPNGEENIDGESDYSLLAPKIRKREKLNKFLEKLGKVSGRDIPILGSAAQAFTDAMGWTNQPDYSNADIIKDAVGQLREVSAIPFGQRLAFIPEDVNYDIIDAQNLVAGNARAAAEMSGGNRNIALASLAPLTLVGVRTSGDLKRKARRAELEQRLGIGQANNALEQALASSQRDADRINVGVRAQRAAALQNWASARDAVDTAVSGAKSKNITNALSLIGQGGLDRENQSMAMAWLRNKGLLDQYNKWLNEQNKTQDNKNNTQESLEDTVRRIFEEETNKKKKEDSKLQLLKCGGKIKTRKSKLLTR